MFSIEDLVSVTTLRKVVELLSEDQQDRFFKNTQKISEEIEEKRLAVQRENEAKKEKAEQVRKLMKELNLTDEEYIKIIGLDTSTLGQSEVDNNVPSKVKRAKTLPKFMIEVDGEKYYWTGRGKFAPKVFGDLSKEEIQVQYAISDAELDMWKENNH
ncbi:H-NS histone family protein [Vibrio atlanticus]|nr:H-NS histone family protein [Vibrio atlanticus]